MPFLSDPLHPDGIEGGTSVQWALGPNNRFEDSFSGAWDLDSWSQAELDEVRMYDAVIIYRVPPQNVECRFRGQAMWLYRDFVVESFKLMLAASSGDIEADRKLIVAKTSFPFSLDNSYRLYNYSIFAAGLCVVLSVCILSRELVQLVVRGRRRKLMRCVECAYPLGITGTCSECGAGVKA